MKLTFALETSSARYGLALGAGGKVLFDTLRDAPDDTSRDPSVMLARALQAVDARVADIEAIFVDIGPGSLGSLRDGVAFANGLAYALGAPVYGFTSFELIGSVAQRGATAPVLCTRRANEGLAYAGVFDAGAVSRMRFGRLEEIVPVVAGEGRAFVAAGSFRAEIAALLPRTAVVVTEIETPEARTMLEIGFAGRAPTDALRSPVFPLHERSALFHD